MINDKVIGIDLSRWNSSVDWGKAKRAGVDFAFLKLSEGNFTDPNYEKYIENINVPYGAYVFYTERLSPSRQRDHVRQMVNRLGVPPMGVWLDIEPGQGYTLNPTNVVTAYDLFSQEKWFGGVYTNINAMNIIGSPNLGTRLWVANYLVSGWTKENYLQKIEDSAKLKPNLPRNFKTWEFWQFTQSAPAAEFGVGSNHLDLNFYNGSYEQFVKTYGKYETSDTMIEIRDDLRKVLAKVEALIDAR